MNELVIRVIETAKRRGLLPPFPAKLDTPVPAINRVELYPTFRCNDRCPHCITNSGPERAETLSPEDANTILGHIAEFSLLKRLNKLYGDGVFRSKEPEKCRHLEAMEKPPKRLSESLKAAYADCLQGKGYKSKWVTDSSQYDLPFGRPSIRISGGEFFMWPFKLNGKLLAENRRLHFQRDLLKHMRASLPEFDIWILTNGRFADSRERADKVVGYWAEHANQTTAGGKTRICISVDVFHRPPPDSTVEKMLGRVWTASRNYGLGAPFLYGIPNNKINYMGRAFRRFTPGILERNQIKNLSGSSFNPLTSITVDPADLTDSDGCKELKGFYIKRGAAGLIANNLVISPLGRLAFCCACLGDFGDFLRAPTQSLKSLVSHPVAAMLRRADTAAVLLNTAAQLDPTIEVVGHGEYAAVTGSTCYQMMTGERKHPTKQP